MILYTLHKTPVFGSWKWTAWPILALAFLPLSIRAAEPPVGDSPAEPEQSSAEGGSLLDALGASQKMADMYAERDKGLPETVPIQFRTDENAEGSEELMRAAGLLSEVPDDESPGKMKLRILGPAAFKARVAHPALPADAHASTQTLRISKQLAYTSSVSSELASMMSASIEESRLAEPPSDPDPSPPAADEAEPADRDSAPSAAEESEESEEGEQGEESEEGELVEPSAPAAAPLSPAIRVESIPAPPKPPPPPPPPFRINTAAAKAVAEKLGVDARRARMVVQYRTVHGLFSSPDDLAQVMGITDEQVLEWEEKGLLLFDLATTASKP